MLQKRGLTSYQYNPNLAEEVMPSLLLLPIRLVQFTASSLFNIQIKAWGFKIKNAFEDACIEMYMRMCTHKYARLGICVPQESKGRWPFSSRKKLV